MLQRRALMAARRASRAAPQFVARRVGAPPLDQRRKLYRRMMLTPLAPKPKPVRAFLQLAERRDRSLRALHDDGFRRRLRCRPSRYILCLTAEDLTMAASGAFEIGGTYLSLQCTNLNCKKIIPLGPNQIPMQGFGVLRVPCPFCGKTYEYIANRALMRVLKELPPKSEASR